MKNITIKALTGLLFLNISGTSLFAAQDAPRTSWATRLCGYFSSKPKPVIPVDFDLSLSKTEIVRGLGASAAQSGYDGLAFLGRNFIKKPVTAAADVVAYPFGRCIRKTFEPSIELFEEKIKKATEGAKTELKKATEEATTKLKDTAADITKKTIAQVEEKVLGKEDPRQVLEQKQQEEDQKDQSDNQQENAPAANNQQKPTALLPRALAYLHTGVNFTKYKTEEMSRKLRSGATRFAIWTAAGITISAVIVIGARHAIKSGHLTRLMKSQVKA
ncbi:MAG TPA: hypothetical protein VGT41_06195 [Candidatus Babeliales bacterium]|nr:hypothetical protein [Candidatus Babeliales bacterium]